MPCKIVDSNVGEAHGNKLVCKFRADKMAGTFSVVAIMRQASILAFAV